MASNSDPMVSFLALSLMTFSVSLCLNMTIVRERIIIYFSILDIPMLFELDLSAVFPLYKFLFLHLFPGSKAE